MSPTGEIDSTQRDKGLSWLGQGGMPMMVGGVPIKAGPAQAVALIEAFADHENEKARAGTGSFAQPPLAWQGKVSSAAYGGTLPGVSLEGVPRDWLEAPAKSAAKSAADILSGEFVRQVTAGAGQVAAAWAGGTLTLLKGGGGMFAMAGVNPSASLGFPGLVSGAAERDVDDVPHRAVRPAVRDPGAGAPVGRRPPLGPVRRGRDV